MELEMKALTLYSYTLVEAWRQLVCLLDLAHGQENALTLKHCIIAANID